MRIIIMAFAFLLLSGCASVALNERVAVLEHKLDKAEKQRNVLAGAIHALIGEVNKNSLRTW